MSLRTLVALAAFVASAAAQTASPVTVNTPTSVQECLPVQLTWSGDNSPFYVSLLPGGQPGATPLKDFGAQTGTSLTWNVDLPASTQVTVQIRDSKGNLNYSQAFGIQKSTTTCPTSTSSAATPVSSGTTSASASKNGTGSASTSSTGNSSSTSTNSTSTGKTGTTGTTSTTGTTGTTSSPSTTSSTTTTPATTGSSSNTTASTNAPSSASARVPSAMLALGVSAAVAIFA